MKITASVRKSLYQDCDTCYLHLPIFLLYFSLFLLKKKKLVIADFLSKIHHRPPYNDIYYETILLCALISVLLTNLTHCL